MQKKRKKMQKNANFRKSKRKNGKNNIPDFAIACIAEKAGVSEKEVREAINFFHKRGWLLENSLEIHPALRGIELPVD